MVPFLRRCRLLPYLNLTARLGALRIPIAGGLGEQLLTVANKADAQRLQAEVAKLTAELATLEEEWLELSSELESA